MNKKEGNIIWFLGIGLIILFVIVFIIFTNIRSNDSNETNHVNQSKQNTKIDTTFVSSSNEEHVLGNPDVDRNNSSETIAKSANIDEDLGFIEEEILPQIVKESEEAAWRTEFRDVKEYVKTPSAGFLYQQNIEMFDKGDLPILYELLKDDEYAPYWENVAFVIGSISDEPNSVTVLVNYFQRDDGYKNFSMKGKIKSLSMIGVIDGDLAGSVLRKAVTVKGARELAMNWIDKEESWPDELLQEHKELAISYIQLAALNGLAYSTNKENHDYLEKLYLEEKNSSNPSQDLGYRNNLVSAIAAKAYIEDHDLGTFLVLSGSGYLKEIAPYMKKYGY